jgi:tetratricopeptide (TPR) repeat protein
MMTVDYKELLQTCEGLLRAGKVGKAAHLVSDLNLSQMPREWRLPLAKICRRAGHTSLGLKLLTPLILSPLKKLNTTPTPYEITEYAVLMQRNGSVDEALRLLGKVDANLVPDADLYRAFCLFNRWDYLGAIPRLEKYVATCPDGYSKLTGQVNLAAAFAMTRNHDPALAILAEASKMAKAGEHRRLEANILEISAQVYLQMDQMSKASEQLDQAVVLLDSLKVHDSVFIHKWQAIHRAKRENSVAPFHDLKEHARRTRFFETVREADLYSLKIEFNQRIYENLLFGTPFTDYRVRLQKETGVHPLTKSTLHGDPSGPVMNLDTGELNGKEIVKAGSKVHQVLSVLLRDFYKPAKVGMLFTEIFPGEYFDIFSSPDRIHQLLKRTRQWVQNVKLPLEITQQQSSYSLEFRGPLAFQLNLNRGTSDWFDIQAQRAAQILRPDVAIGGGDFREAMGMTEAEYKRYLKWALEEGKITRVGGGRSTSYKAA